MAQYVFDESKKGGAILFELIDKIEKLMKEDSEFGKFHAI